MAYTINRFDGSILTVVEDGTIDRNTDIKLVGKNYAGYGEVQNENFVFLLENFANLTPPPRPVSGQIWFDTDTSKLKFYDGSKFRTTGGAEISEQTPAGLTEGDFWWDTQNEQLYAYNGNDFVLVGPQDAGEGITQMQSISVLGTDGISYSVIASVINDNIVHIISNQAFTIAPNPENAIAGFDIIKKGVTLRNTLGSSGGITSSDYIFWGTVSNSNKLGGVDSSQFVQKGQPIFNNRVEFADIGFAIGNSNDLQIKIENDNEAVLSNEVGNVIKLKTKNAVNSVSTCIQVGNNKVLPGQGEEIIIGEETQPFSEIFATNFTGLSQKASKLVVNNNELSGDISPTANTVAVRDNSGDIRANLFRGTALQARYADLAEIYSTPVTYTVGTIVSLCLDSDHDVCDREVFNVIGVVSENPAYLMNSEADGQAIAFTGRVPIRIIGAIEKGQRVYANGNGVASITNKGDFVGIALETNLETKEKLVECVLKV